MTQHDKIILSSSIEQRILNDGDRQATTEEKSDAALLFKTVLHKINPITIFPAFFYINSSLLYVPAKNQGHAVEVVLDIENAYDLNIAEHEAISEPVDVKEQFEKYFESYRVIFQYGKQNGHSSAYYTFITRVLPILMRKQEDQLPTFNETLEIRIKNRIFYGNS